MSCGIASIMMCVFKINKLKPGKDAVTVERDITTKYRNALGSSYNPETTGTYPTLLASVLNGFTSGNWSWHKTPPNDVGKVLTKQVGLSGPIGPIVDVEPVILGVDWDLGGAHWIVVDTIRDVVGTRYATICDPWDANVHLQSFGTTEPFVYHAADGGFMINFVGSTKGAAKPYVGNSAKGQVKNWGMIYRD